MEMLATNWGAIGSFSTLGMLALAAGGVVVNWFRAKRNGTESTHARMRRMERWLWGEPPDPETNNPGVLGYAQRSETFMTDMRKFKGHVEGELTVNGHQTIKSLVIETKDKVAVLAGDVAQIKREVHK